jgi:L-methionine (R)-S-oxide reductase
MAEEINLVGKDNKEAVYQSLMPQIKALLGAEKDLIANLSNITAALKQAFGFFWVGFYLVKNDELVLGPFQGSIACTRIKFGNGVCGTAMAQKKTQLVPDVEKFPGHIACSADSRSEIVLPVIIDDEVVMVLDIDSDKLADFDKLDQLYLEELTNFIAKNYKQWN